MDGLPRENGWIGLIILILISSALIGFINYYKEELIEASGLSLPSHFCPSRRSIITIQSISFTC
jgi:hypothetical protein